MEIFEVADGYKVAILDKPSDMKSEVYKYHEGRVAARLFSGSYIDCRRFVCRYSARIDGSGSVQHEKK